GGRRRKTAVGNGDRLRRHWVQGEVPDSSAGDHIVARNTNAFADPCSPNASGGDGARRSKNISVSNGDRFRRRWGDGEAGEQIIAYDANAAADPMAPFDASHRAPRIAACRAFMEGSAVTTASGDGPGPRIEKAIHRVFGELY
ncbi:unnamed protein product, partial [Urochloa humidicola]